MAPLDLATRRDWIVQAGGGALALALPFWARADAEADTYDQARSLSCASRRVGSSIIVDASSI